MNLNTIDLLAKMNLANAAATRNARLIISEIKKTSDPTEAIGFLREFGGEGWLCATDSNVIRRFNQSKPLPILPVDAWPITAEAAKGESSLHILRVADCWKIALIKRHPGDERAHEVLIAHSFRARDGQGTLCYEVAWKLDLVNGLSELHPYAYRFLGFNVK